MTVPTVRRWRLRRPRAGVQFTGDEAQLYRYAFHGLDSLHRTVGGLQGVSICEIGPGDFLTSGLAMLAAGAASYTAIDRFVGDYSCPEAKKWYSAIEMTWSKLYPSLAWPAWIEAALFPEGYPERVRTCHAPIESTNNLGTFDLVCSFQVGEHVSDINVFANSTAKLLKPDGIAVHRVDFGPHGVWLSYADPLTFLRVPELFWRAMGSARGLPNRRRVREFEDAYRAAGLSVTLTDLEHYPASATDMTRLPARYRAMSPESVLTRSATLVASMENTW